MRFEFVSRPASPVKSPAAVEAPPPPAVEAPPLPAVEAPKPTTTALKPTALKPTSARGKAAAPAPAAGAAPAPAAPAAPSPAPPLTPANSSVFAGSTDADGMWVPPTLSVQLVELVKEDQIAISIAPSANGDGKLLCEAAPAPVFDVVLTAT